MQVSIPEKLAPVLKPYRYKVLYGGRGGGKSWSIARVLLLLALERKRRILCTREYQVSIADSVHRILKDQVSLMDLTPWFQVLKSTIKCVANGSEFIFAGIGNDPDKIKSTEGVDICWVEEAQSVSATSWEILRPTIRKPGSEIWISFNPRQPTDPTYVNFVTNPPPNCLRVEINWWDNPWFPAELKAEKDHSYATDPEAAEHIWEGKTRRRSKAEVLHGKWVVKEFRYLQDWNGPYHGVDWGYAADPTTMVRCWISGDELDRTLWIDRELYKVGVENDELPHFFGLIKNARKHTIRADSARPEQISHMQRYGFPGFTAATKWPGSVEDGIAHLRGYKQIVIHPRCVHAIDEARLWRRKVDRLTGDILPAIIDANNHIWDAVRYAMEPIIRNSQATVMAPPMGPTGPGRFG